MKCHFFLILYLYNNQAILPINNLALKRPLIQQKPLKQAVHIQQRMAIVIKINGYPFIMHCVGIISGMHMIVAGICHIGIGLNVFMDR